MQYLQYIETILKKPTILMPQSRILLLSHMRANTSLFGHLLGSNPQIDGYYELHINYKNRKSLLQQKLKYYHEHNKKKSSLYIFDKVLHNHHLVNLKLFNKNNSKVIIMIRDPRDTIASIIKLYSKKNEKHDLANVNGASEYYLERLVKLKEYSKELNGDYFFLDADQLIVNTDYMLNSLSNWLNLKEPLRKEYQIHKKTGLEGVGDSSDKMNSGVILPKRVSSEPKLALDDIMMNRYKDTLEQLMSNSCNL